jgi:DNA-binding PadR family transcriptional regulator
MAFRPNATPKTKSPNSAAGENQNGPVLSDQHGVVLRHKIGAMMKDESEGCGPKWGWARRGSGKGGPPWMRGAPFGPWARGGGPRPGRMFGQGDLKLLLLALIADKPSHGYDLIRTIETKFGGTYVPSPGTIYPTLTLLEEQELIAGETASGGKKSYTATLQGRQFLATNSEEVKALMTRIDIMAGATQGGAPPDTIMHAVQTLRHAILARSGPWTPAEETRIRTILENAARQIMSGE